MAPHEVQCAFRTPHRYCGVFLQDGASNGDSYVSRAAYTPNREERISNIQEKAGLVMTYALGARLMSIELDALQRPAQRLGRRFFSVFFAALPAAHTRSAT